METRITLIDQNTARRYLATKGPNRNIREKRVEEFIDLIRAGRWETTHQGIAIDETGHLLDGQHRLEAIARCGIAVLVMVTTGVPRSSFMAIDRGSSKSVADIIHPGAKGVDAAIISMATVADRMMMTHNKRSDPKEVEKILLAKGDVFRRLVEFCGTDVKGFSTSSFRLAAARMSEIDETFVLVSYRNMVLHNVQELSKNQVRAFSRVLSDRHLTSSTGSKKLFMLGISAFDPTKKHQTKVQINDESQAGTILRDWIWSDR